MTIIDERPEVAASPANAVAEQPRVSVRGLSVAFETSSGIRSIVSDVSFDLLPGECVAIVGESGSGKSVTARTIVGLTGRGAVVEAERIDLHGRDVRSLAPRRWRGVRGREVGFILQDALVSLDPLRPVGAEIAETLRLHGWRGRRTRQAKVVDLLSAVGVPLPALRARQRSGQLSGGLRQRALIASALALDPDVIIADEPTTALDVTVQALVLRLLRKVQEETGLSVLFISHDLGVVADVADRVVVMYSGEVVEQGPIADLFTAPRHPYTSGLLGSIPALGNGEALRAIPGSIPPPGTLHDTCRFARRCGHRVDACEQSHPLLVGSGGAGQVRCDRAVDLILEGVSV